MSLLKKCARAACMLVALTSGALAHAEPLEPIEHFTKWPAISGATVSPSGKRLAIKVFGPEGQRRVAVMDLDPIGKPRVVAAFEDADVHVARWINDDRLVFDAYHRGPIVMQRGAGTFAVNHDGSGQRLLINWDSESDGTAATAIHTRVLPYGWRFFATLDDGSSDVLVSKLVLDGRGDPLQLTLARLNTLTGELRTLNEGMPRGARSPMLDAQRQPRVVAVNAEGRTKIYWRKGNDNTWVPIADFDSLGPDAFDPWAVAGPDELWIAQARKGGASALYRMHPSTGTIDPDPVAAVPGFDLDDEHTSYERDSQTGEIVGLHLIADRPMSYWFDAGLDRVQRSVDAALPGRSNQLLCGRCLSTRFFVIQSSSDRQPGEYYLFDRKMASIEKIGAERPWIDEAQQGRRTFHRIAARDGLQIPLYVTHPAGADPKRPLPTVMLVHGGPWVRGSNLSWEEEAQFYASRGYRVLEPAFRSSTGYGWKLFHAGWKQWGTGMQDDLVDAIQWAAKQGLVDASRVCIVGASYGGYAALMSPIAHPEAYRCAVSFAGVTDINLMYSITWGDATNDWQQYSMPTLIGDPKKDAALLDAASPLKRVREIKVPVLLFHGGLDRRVPIAHASEFVSAARRAGVKIEQVIYNEEAHGFYLPADHVDYFTRVERFLDENLKGAAH